eukprot:Awhi_evm1s944
MAHFLHNSSLPESRLVKQVQVLKSSFRRPRRSSDKIIKSIITEYDLEESFHDFDRNEMTLIELKYLSRRDNGSNICVCCELDKEESEGHFSLECPLYNEIRDEILLQIMYSSDRSQKEQFNGDDAHRCIILLQDYGAFVSRPLITMEMAIFDIGCQVKTIILFALNMTLVSDFFIGPLRITYSIRLSITYPFTLYNLSSISNLVSTSNCTSTNTLTYSSRVITLITSTTTTTTTYTLYDDNSSSLIQIPYPTLFLLSPHSLSL